MDFGAVEGGARQEQEHAQLFVEVGIDKRKVRWDFIAFKVRIPGYCNDRMPLQMGGLQRFEFLLLGCLGSSSDAAI